MKTNFAANLKKKGFLLVMLALTIIVMNFMDSDNQYAGTQVVIGSDTCTVQYKNNWTGNYRVQTKDGKEFSAKPSQLLIIAQN